MRFNISTRPVITRQYKNCLCEFALSNTAIIRSKKSTWPRSGFYHIKQEKASQWSRVSYFMADSGGHPSHGI
jgi:hypothetical protein